MRMGCLRDVVDRALDASSRTPPRKVSRASRTPTVGSTPKDAAVREGKGKEQPSGGSEKSTTSSVVSEELIALGARKRKAPGRSVGSGDLFEKAQVSMFVKVVLLVKGEKTAVEWKKVEKVYRTLEQLSKSGSDFTSEQLRGKFKEFAKTAAFASLPHKTNTPHRKLSNL